MHFTNQMLITAAILAGTFLIFALGKSPVFRVDRAGAAIIGASLTIASGILSFEQAAQAVDFRTIVLLFSMMIITANLKLSGFFLLMGNILISIVRTKRQLLLTVIMASGLLSALFINDIVCLLFTPVVLMVCRNARITPLPYLIGVATAANIGSAATLIGNPQNILIGSLSGMAFLDYALIAAVPALVGLAANYGIIALVYRRDLVGDLPPQMPITGIQHRQLIIKSLAVTLMVLAGFVAGADTAIAASLGAAYLLVTRRLKPNKVYASIDFNLLVIFAGLFVIIGGVEHSGLMAWTLNALPLAGAADFSAFALLTVIMSNIFSNVPAVLLLKFLVPPNQDAWWAGMALFSTLAGNLTLTGSIANLIVAEIAKGDNVKIGFGDYLKVGLPLTVVTCLIAWWWLINQ